MSYICQVSLTDLSLLSDRLATYLLPLTVLLLEGNLGAGKTTFMQFLGRSLGIKEQITSPTFTLIDEYYSGRLPLYHIDLYRLEPSAIKDLHLELYWQGEEFAPGITAIEWSEKLLTPPPVFIRINFCHTNQEDERRLTWKSQGENARMILENFWHSLPERIKITNDNDK